MDVCVSQLEGPLRGPPGGPPHGAVGKSADELPGVAEAECRLASQIGRPVREPQLADVRLRSAPGVCAGALASRAAELLRAELDRIDSYAGALIEGTLALDRWPLRT